jgi:hypothetical protein
MLNLKEARVARTLGFLNIFRVRAGFINNEIENVDSKNDLNCSGSLANALSGRT